MPASSSSPADAAARRGVRIGLLSPYCGGNLGDAAIHDALIATIRRQTPAAELFGVSLSPAETTALHGIPAFPVAGVGTAHYPVSNGRPDANPAAPAIAPRRGIRETMKRLAQRVPPLFRGARRLRDAARAGAAELHHVVRSFRLLRRTDLLLIAGGGQLDEEWGGIWGHPYALFKWAVLARLTRTPVAFLSVGACRVRTRLGKRFLAGALSRAVYRTYRDPASLQRVEEWGVAGPNDLAPDLAFGLPAGIAERPSDQGPDRALAISPIACGDPRTWPTPDPAGYRRYVRTMAAVVARLLRDGRCIVWFATARPDHQVIDDIEAALPPGAQALARAQTRRPATRTLAELQPVLREVRSAIASRLHGVLLAHLHHVPTVAVSYDPKVTEHMRQMEQAAYCLDIASFDAPSLLARLAALEADAPSIRAALAARVAANRAALDRQIARVVALGRGGEAVRIGA